MVRIEITFYGALKKVTKDKTVEVDASTLKEAIDLLASRYGKQFRDRIYDEKEKIRRYINVYINGKDMRFLDQLNTHLEESDKVSLVPAVGGG